MLSYHLPRKLQIYLEAEGRLLVKEKTFWKNKFLFV